MAETAGRLEKLMAMLEREPRDGFVLYALAMEYKKTGELAAALEYLRRVIEVDARNAAAWQQTGMIHEQSGDVEAAREAYGRGVETAELAGDRHAADEMRGALQMLE